jgi:DNA-binding response OmpR family regulator
MNQKISIALMADDDIDDCTLAKEAFEEAASDVMLHSVKDGIKLMEHLMDADALPSLILLDLNMPKKDGRQALREIKSVKSLQHIPVVIFTTSDEEKDRSDSLKMGADLFITKPAHFSEWVMIMKMLIQNYFQRDEETETRPDNT